jgi:hypothetical protein
MSAVVAPIEDLVDQLDVLYQNTLDRLESQTRDAIIIDRALRQLLDQNESDESILNWNPEKAISPKLAFRALALKIIHQADQAITREVAISPLDYEDLLMWPDEPRRRGQGSSAADEFLRRIDYARNKTLADFWQQFQTRIAPDRDPALAQITAVTDLLGAFAVELPNEYLIPYTRASGGIYVLPHAIKRGPADLEWVIRPEQMSAIARANHGLATMCQLRHQGLFATLILEMNATLHNKLKTCFNQYTPNDLYVAGGVLSLRLQRDHIDFRMSQQLFEIVAETMKPVRGLHFVATTKM